MGQEDDAQELLQRAVELNPDNAAAHHALGLSLVRLKRYPDALRQLEQAAWLEPDDANYIYVYAIALNSLGEPKQAIQALRTALVQHPRNREILSALVSFLRDSGDLAAASRYAEQLRALEQ